MSRITSCTITAATATPSRAAPSASFSWDSTLKRPEDPFFGTIAKAATAALELNARPPAEAEKIVRETVASLKRQR